MGKGIGKAQDAAYGATIFLIAKHLGTSRIPGKNIFPLYQISLVCQKGKRRIGQGIGIKGVNVAIRVGRRKAPDLFLSITIGARKDASFWIYPGSKYQGNTNCVAERLHQKRRRGRDNKIVLPLHVPIPPFYFLLFPLAKLQYGIFHIWKSGQKGKKHLLHSGFIDVSNNVTKRCPALPRPIAQYTGIFSKAKEIEFLGAIPIIDGLIKIKYMHGIFSMGNPASNNNSRCGRKGQRECIYRNRLRQFPAEINSYVDMILSCHDDNKRERRGQYGTVFLEKAMEVPAI